MTSASDTEVKIMSKTAKTLDTLNTGDIANLFVDGFKALDDIVALAPNKDTIAAIGDDAGTETWDRERGWCIQAKETLVSCLYTALRAALITGRRIGKKSYMTNCANGLTRCKWNGNLPTTSKT